jgi:methionyl-tRNA formyltransferase
MEHIMRIVFLGSGAFGLPTLKQLSAEHDVLLVVTQPDRPAGRGRQETATPVGAWAIEMGLPVLKTPDVNDAESMKAVRAIDADAWVIIAFGQKLSPDLLHGRFSMNLHASLLPAYRGAAPIHRAILAGESNTGLSVITIADRIDAGDVLGQRSTPIEPTETTGELHDRLAALGPELIQDVLQSHRNGTLESIPQDESFVSMAAKLTRAEATVSFDQPAEAVRNGIHGLAPWPGCDVHVDGHRLRLLRADVLDTCPCEASAGHIDEDGVIACNPGRIRLHLVQSPGRKPMAFTEWLRGHPLQPGSAFTSLEVSS